MNSDKILLISSTIIIIILIIYILYTHLEAYSDIFIKKCLYISNSEKGGYGVYTSQFIPADTIVEISHTISLTVDERDNSKTLPFYDYNIDSNNTCIALGYGSIYNHSNHKHNLNYIYNDGKMIYTTIQNIYPHSELCVNYGKHYFKDNKIKEL